MAPVTEHHDTLGDQPAVLAQRRGRRAARALPARRADELGRLGGLPRSAPAGWRPTCPASGAAASAATATSRCPATTASSRASSTTPRSSACAWSCTTGAPSGLLWAQRFPERVERLVVINAVPLLPGYRWHRVARAVAHAGRRRGGRRALHALGLAARCSRRRWPTSPGRTSTRAPSARSCSSTARAPRTRSRAPASTSGASTARRSSCGAIATPTSRATLRRRLRRRARRRGRGAAPPRRRALALARPAGCRRSHRRVPGRLGPIPAWALAAVVAARLPRAGPAERGPRGAGVPRRPRPRAVGQRLVRRPSHARLQRALPAAGGAARPAAGRGAERGRGRLALRAPGPRPRRRRASAALWFAVATVTTLITRAADLRAGRRGRPRGGARRRARAPRAGPARWPRSRASPARWPAPSWRWRPRRGGWTARAGGRWRSRPCARRARRRAGRRLPRGRQLPVRRRRASGRRWRPRSPSALVIPRDARVVRIGVALYAVAMVASFALATPMGGNVVRLGALFAGPRARRPRCGARNRRALALLALPLLYWQWVAPVDDWARAAGDASVHERYYDGLLALPGRAARRPVPRRDPVHRQPLGGALGGAARAAGARLGAPGRPRAQRALLRRTSDHARRATAAGSTTTRCASSRSPTRRSTTRRRARPQLVRDGHARTCARSGTTRTGASSRSPAPGRWPRGAARATAIEPERVRLTASRAGRGRPARALHAVLADRRPGAAASRGPGGWTRLRLERPGPVVAGDLVRPRRVRATAPRCTD